MISPPCDQPTSTPEHRLSCAQPETNGSEDVHSGPKLRNVKHCRAHLESWSSTVVVDQEQLHPSYCVCLLASTHVTNNNVERRAAGGHAGARAGRMLIAMGTSAPRDHWYTCGAAAPQAQPICTTSENTRVVVGREGSGNHNMGYLGAYTYATSGALFILDGHGRSGMASLDNRTHCYVRHT